MYLSKIEIKNFRQFKNLKLDLQPGLNLIVGENNSGKSSLIDAIRLTLGTRDNERLWLCEKDFNYDKDNYTRSSEISVECVFRGFKDYEAAPFLEWLGIEQISETETDYFLKIMYTAKLSETESTKYGRRITADITAGPDDKGTQIDGLARDYLRATYLKPLRDAEQELKSKRGSRLSQILSSHPDINKETDPGKQEQLRVEELIKKLNDDIVNKADENNVFVKREKELNKNYFQKFLFADEKLNANIGFSNSDFKDILEKLELNIDDNCPQGLGINNLLFMATELLLLKPETGEYDLPLLLIEEPEAHIHPQYQLNLIKYFEEQVDVQVLMTTHSPNLASSINLEKLTIMKNGEAYPMSSNYTELSKLDYKFLRRFLDVTKANMFFAKGVIFVEGPSEEILIPYIAEKIGKPLHRYGVSIINVGHRGLFRYADIFKRNDGRVFPIKIACITDLDIPSDDASEYLNRKKLKEDQTEAEFTVKPHSKLSEEERKQIVLSKMSLCVGIENAKAFVSTPWTLEHSIALTDFNLELYKAIICSKLNQDNSKNKKLLPAMKKAIKNYKSWDSGNDARAAKIYENLYKKYASKPETMQYFISYMDKKIKKESLTQVQLSNSGSYFPENIVNAIKHVTFSSTQGESI